MLVSTCIIYVHLIIFFYFISTILLFFFLSNETSIDNVEKLDTREAQRQCLTDTRNRNVEER